MDSRFIEGFLQLKLDGHWYIDNHKLKEGAIFEILRGSEWVMLSMEQAEGIFYCLPLISIESGDKVRIEVDL